MEQTQQQLFIQAYKDHKSSLLKRSFFKVSNKAVADDLVQTTFLKTWEFLVAEGRIDSMKAFLFHSLNNLIIDEYRKSKPDSLETITENGFQIAIEDSDRLFDIIDGKVALTSIPLLTKKYREVVTMRYVKHMPLEDIAIATHQSKNTVVVQIKRGVEKLGLLLRTRQRKCSANG